MTNAANLGDKKRAVIGSAARAWALKFSWPTIAEQTVAVYAQAIRGK